MSSELSAEPIFRRKDPSRPRDKLQLPRTIPTARLSLTRATHTDLDDIIFTLFDGGSLDAAPPSLRDALRADPRKVVHSVTAGLDKIHVLRDANGSFIGTVAMAWTRDQNSSTLPPLGVPIYRRREIAWQIAPSFRGMGYAVEAVAAIVDQALASGLGPIIAKVESHNQASLKIIERIGFGRSCEGQSGCIQFEIDGDLRSARLAAGGDVTAPTKSPFAQSTDVPVVPWRERASDELIALVDASDPRDLNRAADDLLFELPWEQSPMSIVGHRLNAKASDLRTTNTTAAELLSARLPKLQPNEFSLFSRWMIDRLGVLADLRDKGRSKPYRQRSAMPWARGFAWGHRRLADLEGEGRDVIIQTARSDLPHPPKSTSEHDSTGRRIWCVLSICG